MRKNIFYSFFLGIFLSFIPLMIHGDAYYRDDMQSQYMPMFYSIGRTIINHHIIPFITTNSWLGGNIAGEFQYGIFNPVEIILYCLLPMFKTLSSAAGFLAVIHYGILTSGAFFFARCLGISTKYSYVSATAIALNNLTYYWFASSWFPEFSSISFMIWAMAFTFRANDSKWYFLATVISTYLTISCGFPQTIVALALFGVVYSILRIQKYRNIEAYLHMFALGLGGMAALISILPTIAMLSVSDRNATDMFSQASMTPALGDLLFFISNPVHPSRMVEGYTYEYVKAPVYYAAWFILPALFFINWREVKHVPQKNLCVLICMLVFLVLAQGPSHIGPLRFPIRFVPFFQTFLIVSILYFFDKYKESHLSKIKKYIFCFSVIVSNLITFLQYNNKFIFVSISILLSIYFGIKISKEISTAKLIAITILFAFFSRITGGFYNHNMPRWTFEPEISKNINLNAQNSFYNMCLVDEIFDKKWNDNKNNDINHIWFGNIGLILNNPSVNGYSPIKQYGLFKRFFHLVHGVTPIQAGIRGLEVDPVTGMAFFDLMRVKNVIAAQGVFSDLFMREKMPGWEKIEDHPGSTTFSHILPNQNLPGTLSWPIAGLSAAEESGASATKETITISSRTSGVNKLIFARTFWPGYQAKFNNVAIPVSPFSGFLLSADLPNDNSTGILEISYHVPYIKISTIFLLLSAAMTFILMNVSRFWNISHEPFDEK